MLKILLIVLLTSLPQKEIPKKENILQKVGEEWIEKCEESTKFSQLSLFKEEKEIFECKGKIKEKEILEILDQQKLAVKNENSLKGIETDAGKILQQQQITDEIAGQTPPALEDLRDFVKETKSIDQESPTNNPYDKLLLTPEDKQKISKILTTMANNNVLKLLFERKRLERLGHEVNHVHPVRFLGAVFNDPRLVHCMRRIRTSGFKWGGFIDGISERFKQELHAKNIDAYIPGLAEHLDLRGEDIQAYINKWDIEGLILFLIERRKPSAGMD